MKERSAGCCLTCRVCGAVLQFNGKRGFWRCPDCGGEWWPGLRDDDGDGGGDGDGDGGKLKQ